MIISTTFDEVSLPAEKTVKCSGGCGRRLKRRRKFWQTLNPYNKNEKGIPKERQEIFNELVIQATEWRGESEICIHCPVD